MRLDFYSYFLLLHDQPTTCPFCGARTHWVDFYDAEGDCQINLCLEKPFEHYFLTCEDDEFGDNDDLLDDSID